MNINKMTKQQCKRIIDNNYLGAHDRKGRQVDYHDYAADIRARYYQLVDKEQLARVDMPNSPLERPMFDIEAELAVAVNRAFKPWRDIANKLEVYCV
jgi:hypothetical protein